MDLLPAEVSDEVSPLKKKHIMMAELSFSILYKEASAIRGSEQGLPQLPYLRHEYHLTSFSASLDHPYNSLRDADAAHMKLTAINMTS